MTRMPPFDPNDETAWESAMSSDFDARVRDMHEAPLALDDIKDAARTIRRRRRTAVAGAVLAVTAIVVPAALLAGPSGDSDAGLDLAQDPTADDQAEPSYLADGVWHRTDGGEVTLPAANYNRAVAWNDHLVALRQVDEQGRTLADVIDETGHVTDTFETTGGVAVNEPGTTLAWLDEDGRIIVRWDGGEAAVSDPGVQSWVRAVTGGPDCRAAGCAVFTERFAYSSDGTVAPVAPEEPTVNDAGSGLVSVTDEVTDGSSCGGVYEESTRSLRFRTCGEHTYDEIAPGGAYVLGLPDYLDGIGPGRAAILDAEDGTELARYDAATVIAAAWVDASRLLIEAYDYDARAWRLVMLAADGTVTKVAGPVTGEDLEHVFVPIGR